MGIASRIAEIIRGHNCERLVQYSKQEVSFAGLSGEGGGYKVSLASFSNTVKATNTVTEVMKALDNNQYLLCQQAHDSSVTQSFRDKCLQARVMCTIGLSNFQALAALQEPGKPLCPEIKEWVKKMNDLTLRCMESFVPNPTAYKMMVISSGARKMRLRSTLAYCSKAQVKVHGIRSDNASNQKNPPMNLLADQPKAPKKTSMTQIMKYQGIDKEDMENAIQLLKKE